MKYLRRSCRGESSGRHDEEDFVSLRMKGEIVIIR
jgi:hypothetical protein